MGILIYFEVVLWSEQKKRKLPAETKKKTKKPERKVLDGNDDKLSCNCM